MNLKLLFYPHYIQFLLDLYLKDLNIMCNPKMEVVSHNLLVKLVKNEFGVGLVTKEFISEELNKTLFQVKVKANIPKRELGYAVKKDMIPSFTTKKFIDLITHTKEKM